MVVKTEIVDTITVAVTNAQGNATIASRIAPYGFDSQRMNEGLALAEQVTLVQEALKAAEENIQTARQHCQTSADTFSGQLLQDRQLARLGLKDDAVAYKVLGLNQPPSLSLKGLDSQAELLYTGLAANAGWLAKCARWGLHALRVEQGVQYRQGLDTARSERNARTNEARALRRQLHEAIAAAEAWMKDFTKIIRLALASEPELMAILGIKPIIRTGKSKKSALPIAKPLLPPGEEPVNGRPLEEKV